MGTDLKSFIGQWKSKPEMIKDGGSRYAGVNHSIAQPPSLLKLQSQHNLSSSLPSFLNNVPDIPTTPPSSPQLPQSPVSTAHHPRYLISKLTNTHLDDVIGGGRRRTNSLNLLESLHHHRKEHSTNINPSTTSRQAAPSPETSYLGISSTDFDGRKRSISFTGSSADFYD